MSGGTFGVGEGPFGIGTYGGPVAPRRDDVTLDELLAVPPQRLSTVRYDLVDKAGDWLGTIHPTEDHPPSLVVQTSAILKRSLRDVWLTPDEQADVNVFEDRVRPTWVWSNGDETPMPTFLFAYAARAPLDDTRSRFTGHLTDLLATADQPAETSQGWPAGTRFDVALAAEWERTGYPAIVDPTAAAMVEDMGWPVETTSLRRMIDISDAGGYLDPYLLVTGLGRSRLAPDLAATEPDVTYDLDVASRIEAGSIVEWDDLLDAPNRWLFVGASPTNVPIVVSYELGPEWPHSRARRGFPVTETVRAEGVETADQALAVLHAAAIKSDRAYRYVEFDTPPDPRHDVYSVVGFRGDTYLESEHRLTLTATASHHHKIARSYG